MINRKSKKPVARKRTAARKTARAAPRKAKRGYDIQPGQPTGREVQAMHRLQVLTERYIGEGLTPADARTKVYGGRFFLVDNYLTGWPPCYSLRLPACLNLPLG
jgi:hypothetical protein